LEIINEVFAFMMGVERSEDDNPLLSLQRALSAYRLIIRINATFEGEPYSGELSEEEVEYLVGVLSDDAVFTMLEERLLDSGATFNATAEEQNEIRNVLTTLIGADPSKTDRLIAIGQMFGVSI
jgi:hypothetical protein